VVAVHAGFIDTDMAAPATNVPKDSPESVAQQTFDAVEAGLVEVLADERTATVKAQLSRDQELIYPPIQTSGTTLSRGAVRTPLSARNRRQQTQKIA
jgi:hypothetical protein